MTEGTEGAEDQHGATKTTETHGEEEHGGAKGQILCSHRAKRGWGDANGTNRKHWTVVVKCL